MNTIIPWPLDPFKITADENIHSFRFWTALLLLPQAALTKEHLSARLQ